MRRADRLLRGLWGIAWSGWVGFVAWMLAWGMLISAAWALLFAWSARPWSPPSRLRSSGIFGLGLVLVGLIGLPEYARTANTLHCRALGFTGASPRAHTACSPEALAAGRQVARDGGPLLSTRERLAVHGFNLLMAAGGYATGLPEVADETLWLSLASDPLAEDGGMIAASTQQRRQQCQASSSSAAVLAPEIRRNSDFLLRSGVVRAAVATALPRLGRTPGDTVKTQPLHWVRSDSYTWSLQHDSVRVALALEVEDSRAMLERQDDGRVMLRWTGHMHYPPQDINLIDVPLPTLLGPTRLRLSETIFCAMHVDGAMNPYHMVWQTLLDEDDPRLRDGRQAESEAGLLHRAAGFVLGG